MKFKDWMKTGDIHGLPDVLLTICRTDRYGDDGIYHVVYTSYLDGERIKQYLIDHYGAKFYPRLMGERAVVQGPHHRTEVTIDRRVSTSITIDMVLV